jgi:hypothetical protein
MVAKKLQEKKTKHNLILMSSFALVKNKFLNSDPLSHTFVIELLAEKCNDSSRY